MGTEEFIHEARRNRKVLGGGMRQVGIIAAPGIYALNNMVDRLSEDHKHAQMLEKALLEIPGMKVKPVDTNLVVSDLSENKWNASEVRDRFEKQGILVSQMCDIFFRMVTYYGISKENIEKVIETLPEVFQ